MVFICKKTPYNSCLLLVAWIALLLASAFTFVFPEMSTSPSLTNGPSQDPALVTLTDELGRSLSCQVQQRVEVDGKDYALLLPHNAPVEIFVWQVEGENEIAVLLETDAEIDRVFSTAKAVLQELNLTLQRTALTLTVAGDLPPAVEEEILTLEMEDDTLDLEPEQFQMLATFFHEDREYAIYTPVDPLMFFAQFNRAGHPELISPEQFLEMQPLLEEQFFADLGLDSI